MELTANEVEHIANLARLALTESDLRRYRGQLSEILAYAAKLSLVDTSGIPPTARIGQGENILREDLPRTGLETDELFYNAPDSEDQQFKVPPVLE